jgi:hypothetical protein
MSFLRKLFGNRDDAGPEPGGPATEPPVDSGSFRCSNCHALVFESALHAKGGICGACADSEGNAERRRSLWESQAARGVRQPKCAVCGRTEEQIHRHLAEDEKEGAWIYARDWPTLLYCEQCHKYFCACSQVDLGMNSGCPVCRRVLV